MICFGSLLLQMEHRTRDMAVSTGILKCTLSASLCSYPFG